MASKRLKAHFFRPDFLIYFYLIVSETKNQWARDDPAFVVILCLFLVVATSAYCAA